MNRTHNFLKVLQGNRVPRGLVWGVLILAALLAFELFNYSTTEFAMTDLLGDLRFAGIRWSTILAIAFCGIDFAGIARLFTPEKGANEPAEVWYLFAAWLLAAAMNATLTWWGISIAIASHEMLGNAIIPRQTLIRTVPVFVALIVLLIRILIIGSFSVAGERLFSQPESYHPQRTPAYNRTAVQARSASSFRVPVARGGVSAKASQRPSANRPSQPDLTYEPVQMKGRQGSGRIGSPMA